MAHFYPKAAAAANVEGDATIRCNVTDAGLLADCTVLQEAPAGQGFGEAALNLAQLFKMRPMTRNGVPVSGGKINIPIRFRLPKETMPSLVLATRCYGLAAAAAEQDPGSAEAQVAVIAWRMVLSVRTLPEHPRPSEFDQMLTELRTSAASKLDDPAAKGDRDECAAQLHDLGATVRGLEAMARQ
jgi:TonB family protein